MTKWILRRNFSLYVRGQMTREEEGAFEDSLKKNGLVHKAKTLANKYRKTGVILYVSISIISSRLPIEGEQLKQLMRIQNLQQLPSIKSLLENTQHNEEEIILEKENLIEPSTPSLPKGLGMALVRTLVIMAIIIFLLLQFFL